MRSLLQLSIPCVKLILRTSKSDLTPSLGVDDPEDAGIFSRNDSQIDRWKIIAAVKNLEIEQTKTEFVSDLRLKMASVNIKEDTSSQNQPESTFISKEVRKQKRFPTLMKCDKGLQVGIMRIDRAWSKYANEDMVVSIDLLGQFVINWQPLAMNRLVRFLKFMKLKSEVKKLALHDWLSRYRSFNMLKSSGSDKCAKSGKSSESAGSSNCHDQERAHEFLDDSGHQQSQQHSSSIEDCTTEP